MVSGLVVGGFRTTCNCKFRNRDLVQISTALERQLEIQGLAGFAVVCFLLFLGGWCLDGFGNGFFVSFAWMLDPFWYTKSIKNGMEIDIYC